MAPTLQALGIDHMSVEDRISLATAIWDSIEAQPHDPLLSDLQRQELDRRLVAYAANPKDVIPWEQMQSDAIARFKS